MIAISNSSEFQDVINELESSRGRIEEIFNKQNASVATINDNDNWQGMTEEAFQKQYNELSNNYQDIDNAMNAYITFLKTTLDNYTRLENKIGSDADNNAAELNVNS